MGRLFQAEIVHITKTYTKIKHGHKVLEIKIYMVKIVREGVEMVDKNSLYNMFRNLDLTLKVMMEALKDIKKGNAMSQLVIFSFSFKK